MDEGINLTAPDAEELVLSSCMESASALMAAVGSGLRPGDFGSPSHELIFRTMRDMMDRGQSVDSLTLSHQLKTSGKLDLVGGQPVIDRLVGMGATAHDAGDYAAIIKDRAIRREMFDATEGIVNLLHSEPDPRQLITSAENLIYRVSDKLRGGATQGIKAEDLVDLYRNRKGAVERIPYSYETLNANNKGRARGALTLWGGYSSDGKTTLGLKETLSVAKLGFNCAIFSLEMTDEELLYRLLANQSGVEKDDIEEGTMTLNEAEAVEDAARVISGLNITTYHDPGYTPSEIRSIQQRAKHDYVCVDYLQRFHFNEWVEIPRIAKQFKNIAMSTNSCVDLLSQLTPAQIKPGENPFPVPSMNSWYGGKATGHEADNAFAVWAHRQLGETGSWDRTGKGEIISLKQRGGKGEFRFPVQFNETRIQWEEPNVENLFRMSGARPPA